MLLEAIYVFQLKYFWQKKGKGENLFKQGPRPTK